MKFLSARTHSPAGFHVLKLPFLLLWLLVSCSQPEPGRSTKSKASSETGSNPVGRGVIISSSQISRKSAQSIALQMQDNGLAASAAHGVVLYKIVYGTIDAHGRPTVASGALAIPEVVTTPLPLLSYQHGTVVHKEGVASSYGFDLSSMMFGGGGYVVAIPDYLGLGESPGLHPYVHGASLATSVIDMLRAARQFCGQQKVALSGELFLMGYSEGGYATMAAHRAIETDHANEFSVTASAPMAGPYDMSGTMRELFMSNARYANPFYMPYVVLAYNEVYGLAESLDSIFAAPYAKYLPDLFDGTEEGFDINRDLPPVPKEMLHPEFLRNFQNDSLNPLRRALRQNDMWDWTPRAPMRLYHCTADRQVPFANSRVAYDSFRKRGATQVELVPLDNGDHGACGLPSIMEGKEWFDSLRGRSR